MIVPNHLIPRLPGGKAPVKENMFNFVHTNDYRAEVGKANTKSWGSLTYTEIHPNDLSVYGA